MDYLVYPEGKETLSTMVLEKDSPIAKAFLGLGAKPYLLEGMNGYKVENIFYAPDPNYLNVISIQGVGGTGFFIEMPVSKVSIPRAGEIVFHDEDSKTDLYISGAGFHIDIGGKPMQTTMKKGFKKSPW